jgi:hypothetical protein
LIALDLDLAVSELPQLETAGEPVRVALPHPSTQAVAVVSVEINRTM